MTSRTPNGAMNCDSAASFPADYGDRHHNDLVSAPKQSACRLDDLSGARAEMSNEAWAAV
jgi:hypothetical protein